MGLVCAARQTAANLGLPCFAWACLCTQENSQHTTLPVVCSPFCSYLCGLQQNVWDVHATEELQRLPELGWRADVAQ